MKVNVQVQEGKTDSTSKALAIDPRLSTRHRQPGLDLLRAIAIVFVVLYHAGLFGFVLPGGIQRFGWIGVDLFFVLSGYLIAGQLLASLARDEKPSVTRFYWRRALRILPAFLVILAIYLFLPAWREYPTMPPAWKFLTFTQNFGLHGGTSFSHAWSLCIEAQFYLLLPFVLLVLVRWQRSQWIVPYMIVLAGILVRAWIAYTNAHSPVPSFAMWQENIYYPTYSRLDPLTLGVCLAAIEHFRPAWWTAILSMAKWMWFPGLAAIALALVLAEDTLSVTNGAFGFLLVALGFSALLICALSPDLPFSRMAIPGAAFLATVAYSVYLSHKLLIHGALLFGIAYPMAGRSVIGYLLMLFSVVIGGVALFFAVERPFLKLRQGYGKSQIPPENPTRDPDLDHAPDPSV